MKRLSVDEIFFVGWSICRENIWKGDENFWPTSF